VLGDTARHLADHYPVETWRPRQPVGAPSILPRSLLRKNPYEILRNVIFRLDDGQNRIVSRPISFGAHAIGMTSIRRLLRSLNDRAGQALVEYSLILALVVVILIMVVMVLGNQVKNTFCNVSGAFGP
jgi:Flp pilus assembly pilin Flp